MGDPDGQFVSNETAQKRVRVTVAVVLAIGWALAYLIWPTGITDTTLSQMTLGEFFRVLASVFTAIGFIAIAVMLSL